MEGNGNSIMRNLTGGVTSFGCLESVTGLCRGVDIDTFVGIGRQRLGMFALNDKGAIVMATLPGC